MGAYAPAGFCNKKAPKFFQTLVQTFLCTAYCSFGKAEWEIGTEYPDLVRGAKARSFRKAFPGFTRVTALLRRRKEHTPYSAVSASGICTPFLCTRANPARAVFLYAIFCFFLKFFCTVILRLLFAFVNSLCGIFTDRLKTNASAVQAPAAIIHI